MNTKIIFFVLGVYFVYYLYNILRDLFSPKNENEFSQSNQTNIAFEELEHQPTKVDASFLEVKQNDDKNVEALNTSEVDPSSQEEDLSQEIAKEDYVKAQKKKAIEENEEGLKKISETEEKKISLFSNIKNIEVKISNSFSDEKNKLLQELINNPDSIDITQELSLFTN